MDTLFLSYGKPEQGTAIRIAAEGIRSGELVAFPTETVYGLGANIYDERAVGKIFEVKGRPPDNPLIVHIASIEDAAALVMELPEVFFALAEKYFPGPLTIVLRRSAAVLDIVTAGLDTVAIRMPDHERALELIGEAGVPLAAPSANISGKASPVTAQQAYSDLAGKVYAVLDGGPCTVGIESTVLDITGKAPCILRPGMISCEELESVLGTEVSEAKEGRSQPRSPGVKYRHYEPNVPLILVAYTEHVESRTVEKLHALQSAGRRVALLAPGRYQSVFPDAFYSFGTGTAVEYARLLYSGLRRFSPSEADILLCPGIPESGAGLAVMNRLRKSAMEIIE